jgi:osmotically-inducible protein OsmY
MINAKHLLIWGATAAASCASSASTLPVGCASASCSENLRLSEAVQSAIYAHSAFAGGHVWASASGGVVYLHGLVDTTWEQQQAVQFAQNTAGVRQVINDLAISNE